MWKIREVKKRGMKTFIANIKTLILVGIIVNFIVGKTSTNNLSYETTMLLWNLNQELINEHNINPDNLLSDDGYKNIFIDYSNKIIEQFFDRDLSNRVGEYNEQNNIKKGVLYSVFNILTDSKNSIKNMVESETNSLPKIIIMMCIIGIINILIKLLLINPLIVGSSRLYLENNNYKKTRVKVLKYAFKKGRYLGIVKTMTRMDIYDFLWGLTIIGWIIKHYSYLMVKYIIAENPNIDSEECIKMSREMMKGSKWKMFLMDVTFIPWNILATVTFGVSEFFSRPYYESCKAELYRKLREDYIKNEKFNHVKLNDELLFDNKKNVDTYRTAKTGKAEKEKRINPEKLNVKYGLWDCILFFFIFAFTGWIWEVGYFAVHFGVIVNRGSMYGPWLPIYGFGCTLAIVLFSKFKFFKKIQANPLRTFLCVMLFCTILEYLGSVLLELSTGEKYWDYTGIFMNINGRVCLENSLFFGAGGSICIYFVGPWLKEKLSAITNKTKKVLCITLVSLFLTDFIITNIHPHYGDFISNDPSLE